MVRRMKVLALVAAISIVVPITTLATERTFHACMKAALDHIDEYECEKREVDDLKRRNHLVSRQIRSELMRCVPHMVGYNYKDALQSFDRSSRNWSAFVDGDCDVTDATWGPGTNRADDVNHCYIDHLRYRNKRLVALHVHLVETREYLLELSIDSPEQQGPNGWITCNPADAK